MRGTTVAQQSSCNNYLLSRTFDQFFFNPFFLHSVYYLASFYLQLASDSVTFEFLCANVQSCSSTRVIVIIYWPGSQTITSAFFDDLSKILDCHAGYNEPTYIVGDLNVHLDRQDDPESCKLTELRKCHACDCADIRPGRSS